MSLMTEREAEIMKESHNEAIDQCIKVLESTKITRTAYPRTRKLGLVSLTERRVASYNIALETAIEKLKDKLVV